MPPYEKKQIFQKNAQKPRRDLKTRSSGKNPAVVTLVRTTIPIADGLESTHVFVSSFSSNNGANSVNVVRAIAPRCNFRDQLRNFCQVCYYDLPRYHYQRTVFQNSLALAVSRAANHEPAAAAGGAPLLSNRK